MKLYKYKGTGDTGVFSWLMQRISGIILLFAIAYHVIGMTLGGISNGMPTFVLGLILIFGVWHAVSGLKMITDDYVSCPKKRLLLLLIYWVIGIGVLVQGLKILSMMTFN